MRNPTLGVDVPARRGFSRPAGASRGWEIGYAATSRGWEIGYAATARGWEIGFAAAETAQA
ncbi:MAG TPA: hypothetical protein VGJ95_10910 [Pseudonocardiaceae bacterium]|jgi:hypothetical protein